MKPIHNLFIYLLLILFICSCSKDSNTDEGSIDEVENLAVYFPPTTTNEWETISLEDLGWNTDAEEPLYNFLEASDTDAFLVIKNGRIVIEKYFGDFTQNDNHVWNSAGKTLTAMTAGIAQAEGLLSLNDTSADYLGTGWSNLTPEQEQNITIKHHLTMTTGLDYTVTDPFCTDKACLLYKNDSGGFWFYHNAPYIILDQIISNATGKNFEDYFTSKIKNRIGMQGIWLKIGYNHIYFSTARSMARFGILNLNKGVWNSETILSDAGYFNDMTNTSQTMNKAYGYLFWLNGKESYRVPGSELEFIGQLIPNAPSDLYVGLGKNDQKLYVVPSEKLVIVRMGGDASEALLGPSSFDNKLWGMINDVTK